MRILLPTVLFLLFLCASCGDDNTAIGESTTVAGGWELERATRNNMETELLDGLFFEFKEDGTLVTNLMGNDTEGTYEWDGDQITTAGVNPPMTYKIKEMTDSTLNIQSKFQGFQFSFELSRKETE